MRRGPLRHLRPVVDFAGEEDDRLLNLAAASPKLVVHLVPKVRDEPNARERRLLTQLAQRGLNLGLADLEAALGELPSGVGVADECAVHHQELDAAFDASERDHAAGDLAVNGWARGVHLHDVISSRAIRP
jgi:hypothetical protein